MSEAETASTVPMTKTGQGCALMSVPRLGIAMNHNVSTLVNPTAAVGLPTRPTLRDGDGFRCALAATCWLRASEHLVGEHVIDSPVENYGDEEGDL